MGWLADIGKYLSTEGVKAGVEVAKRAATKWIMNSARLGIGSDGATVSAKLTSCPSDVFGLPYCQIGLALGSFSEGAHVNSTLKIQTPEAIPLIEKIRAELKKRAEAKAKRMLLKRPKKLAKRYV
jgi:hypothetical protein